MRGGRSLKRSARARAGIALVVLSAVVVASAGGAQQARPRHAKEYLASALEGDRRALSDLRSPSGLEKALARIRASQRDLGAALDTLGAAELPAVTTGTIRGQLMSAVGVKGRALAAPASRDSSVRAGRLARAVRAALGRERKAADLLGDAPRSPAITELPIPFAVFGAFDLALGPDGQTVWVSGPDASRILLYPSLDKGGPPIVYRLAPGTNPHGMIFGRDGALYIAETGTNIGGNAIARLTPAGQVHEFFLPAGAGGPWGIAVGSDDKIWFTEVTSGKIGRLDPLTGTISEFQLPTPNSQPQGIVLGSDGALWGTEAAGNRVFRIDVDGHATEFPIPTPDSVPVSIAAGRGGVLWVSELSGGKLLRISTAGRIREFPLPRGARPYGVVSAPDGNVWFSDRGRNRIGLVTPAGRVFDYLLPTPKAQPTAIVPLAVGEFAFTEFVANRVGTLRFPAG
jgi:virginiamycin B lyase